MPPSARNKIQLTCSIAILPLMFLMVCFWLFFFFFYGFDVCRFIQVLTCSFPTRRYSGLSIPFRLAATATPAPNDFMELCNHAECLGVMKYTDMLATFFAHDGGSTQNWRLKGHAENEFWRWMASRAVMLRKPSDLGYPNAGYDLQIGRAHV